MVGVASAVSKPVREVVETGDRAFGLGPASSRHATVSVEPFQEA